MTQGRSVKLNVNFSSLKIETSKMKGLINLCEQLVVEGLSHKDGAKIVQDFTLHNEGEIKECNESSSTQYRVGNEAVVTQHDDKFKYQVIQSISL